MHNALETPASKGTCKSQQFYGIHLILLLLVEINDQVKRDEELRSHLLPSRALQELGGYKVGPPFLFRWIQTATNTDC